MDKRRILVIFIFISIIGICLNFNCKINIRDKCETNTICNESGICVCNNFMYGNNCEKKLSDISSLNINKGVSLESYLTLIILLSILLPIMLIIGLFLIFLFLKGRDGTYTT
jgi:hypothetical protein